MTTFTVTLSDDQARQLQEMAREAGIGPEALIKGGLEEWLNRPRSEFAAVAAYVLEKNRELYRRLA